MELKRPDPALFCIQALGRSLEDQVVEGTKALYTLIYNIWKVLQEEFGPEDGNDRYGTIWTKLIERSFQRAKAALGIEEVKDMVTLGKIRKHISQSYPAMYRVVEEDESKHFAQITWCPNAAFSPPDYFLEKLAYFKYEAELTQKIYEQILELAGLSKEAEAKLGRALCLGQGMCELFFEKKKDRSEERNGKKGK